MKTILLGCISLLLLSSQPAGKDAQSVEQTIGGLTVGTSTLDDAKQMFGKALSIERDVYIVRFDDACKLSFVLEDVRAGNTARIITTISLRNISPPEGTPGGCDNVSTGKGLKLSDPLENAQRIYGNPHEDFVRNGVRVLGYDNRVLCSYPGTKAIEFKALGIERSEDSKRLLSIEVDVSSVECEELRSNP